MAHKYRVGFFKRLADSTGHAVDACQAIVEVSAPSKQQAINMARRRFAEDCAVGKWWLRADYETAVLAEEPNSMLEPNKRLVGHVASDPGMPH